ncbi:MAG: hypothetical protein PUP93_33295, partial [Rhizonema sp. NSF051]|nr:hypothetical protein [Rhizonema sp. NSF051]
LILRNYLEKFFPFAIAKGKNFLVYWIWDSNLALATTSACFDLGSRRSLMNFSVVAVLIA